MQKNIKPVDLEKSSRILDQVLKENEEVIQVLKEHDGEFSGDALKPENNN